LLPEFSSGAMTIAIASDSSIPEGLSMSASSQNNAKPKRVNPNQHIIDQIKKVLPPPGEDWGFYVKGVILGTFFLGSLAIIAYFATGAGRSDPNPTHELSASVVIANPENYTTNGESCRGAGDYAVLADNAYVKIEREGKGPMSARLGAGKVNANGTCGLGFALTTAASNTFVFTIGDLDPISRTSAELSDGSATDQWTTTLSWDS
jgi:hypothetical protein